MEAVGFSKTSMAIYQSTLRKKPKNLNPQTVTLPHVYKHHAMWNWV